MYIGKANFLYTSESIKNTIIPRNRDKQIHIICFPYFSEKLKIFGCSSLKATEYMVMSPKKMRVKNATNNGQSRLLIRDLLFLILFIVQHSLKDAFFFCRVGNRLF